MFVNHRMAKPKEYKKNGQSATFHKSDSPDEIIKIINNTQKNARLFPENPPFL
jgi:hypothetical protein